jgi:hypothetical protein
VLRRQRIARPRAAIMIPSLHVRPWQRLSRLDPALGAPNRARLTGLPLGCAHLAIAPWGVNPSHWKKCKEIRRRRRPRPKAGCRASGRRSSSTYGKSGSGEIRQGSEDHVAGRQTEKQQRTPHQTG